MQLLALVRFLLSEPAVPPWSVEVVCRSDPALDNWCRQLEADGARVRRLSAGGVAAVTGFLRRFRHADLVHLHLAYPVGKLQLMAAVVARLRRRPSVATHHLALEPADFAMRPARRAVWSRLLSLYARLIDQHIAISKTAAAILMRRYRIEPSRISVIYNGVDLDRFSPVSGDQRLAIRQRLLAGLAPGIDAVNSELICSVSRLAAQKGLDDLIDAARTVTGAAPAACFVVIGEGEDRPKLERRLAQSGVKRFLLIGRREPSEVAEWLRAADLFVLASRYEGGPPLAMMEAMAAGRAVVATRVAGVDELINDEGLGSIVPIGDAPAMAAAVRTLLEDGQRRAQMGQRAQRRVGRDFDQRRSLALTRDLYLSMLDGRR